MLFPIKAFIIIIIIFNNFKSNYFNLVVVEGIAYFHGYGR